MFPLTAKDCFLVLLRDAIRVHHSLASLSLALFVSDPQMISGRQLLLISLTYLGKWLFRRLGRLRMETCCFIWWSHCVILVARLTTDRREFVFHSDNEFGSILWNWLRRSFGFARWCTYVFGYWSFRILNELICRGVLVAFFMLCFSDLRENLRIGLESLWNWLSCLRV